MNISQRAPSAKALPLHEWHPHANLYPLLEDVEFEAFKQDIAVNGQQESVKYRMVHGKKQGLDGRNRERACIELGIECHYEKVFLDDADVKAYIDSRNLHRRHLTREQRQLRVQVMREEGHSLRDIASTLGVGSSTVKRDIADSNLSAGVPNGTPEIGTAPTIPQKTGPRKVTGKDGKSYAANKAACSDPKIPERLVPIFGSVSLFNRVAKLCTRLANQFEELEKTPAYLKAVNGKKHRVESTCIRAAGKAVEAMTPKCPCPECGGKYEPSLENDPCSKCGEKGYLTAEEVGE
jgi:hypothetical protein